MRKPPPRSGFFYSEDLQNTVHHPDLEVHGGRLMQPIGFTAQHIAPKPVRRVTKKKSVKRRALRAQP
jgi:hypothetical protein